MESLVYKDLEKSEMINSFNENGFLILKNQIPEDYYANIEKSYLVLLKKYAPTLFSKFQPDDVQNSLEFHQKLIQFRADTPSLFSAVYDSMTASISILKITISEEVLNPLCLLMNKPREGVVCFNHGLRMDVPFDKRNISGWHQDTFNDEAYHDYKAGITIWMPVLPVSPKNGSLIICLKSHNERVGRFAEKKDGDYASLSYNIPESIRNNFEQTQITMNRGDLLLLSMNLIHSSGTNSSEYVRLTVQSRFYPVEDSNFVPGVINYKSTKNIQVPWNN